MQGVKFVSVLERAMKICAACCLMGMALMTGADVVSRGAFNAPIFGAEEIVALLAVLAAGLALPYTHAQGANIGVDIVVRALPKAWRRRVQFVVDVCGCALFAVIGWRMALYGLSMQKSGEVSMNLELPTFYILFVLSFCFFALALRLLAGALSFFSKEAR